MDIRPIRTPPTAEEVAALDAALADAPTVGRPEARRTWLLPALHALQDRVGWISPGGLGEACRRLQVPPAEAYGVATFYAWFSTTPRPRRVVHVCDDVACKARGADALLDDLAARRGPERVGAVATWQRSPCLGLCDQAPAALIQQAGLAPFDQAWTATADTLAAALDGLPPPDPTPSVIEGDRLLRRVGRVDPTSIDAWRAAGGLRALPAALAMGPDAVIRELHASRLAGRGGAAFPAARKWEAVRGQPTGADGTRSPSRVAGPAGKWLVCNADESEPGTFKDRVLMEGDPFALLEAMAIAGTTCGCERGIIYLRAEYPLAAARLRGAIRQARAAGMLGPDVLGSGIPFDVELRRGAGAYICGEETALLESIEGFRGEPRSKPPFPVEVGLFGRPTLIHNVETLMNVPDIVLDGGAAFAAIGTPSSTGTRLFCLSGHVARPGLYEAPFGVTLRALLARAGGPAAPLVLLGGSAGGFVDARHLDLPLTFEDTRRVGATLGSGVVLVLDAAVDLLPYLRRIAAFFRDESCGQCTPCRVGTVRQEEALARLARGAPLGDVDAELQRLAELDAVMRDASICGLGQTASSAVRSALAMGRLGGAR